MAPLRGISIQRGLSGRPSEPRAPDALPRRIELALAGLVGLVGGGGRIPVVCSESCMGWIVDRCVIGVARGVA